MEIDTAKIDEAVLALLYLTLHDQVRAWTSLDRTAMIRLRDKGLIHDPENAAKSVVLTDAGLKEAERIFTERFTKPVQTNALVQYGGATANVRAAEGVTGHLCRSAVDGRAFFRTYRDDGSFADYALRHDDLRVTIASDALASFYHVGDEASLDHSPQVLGLPHCEEKRVPGC